MSRPEPTWILNEHGEPDYAATAIAMSKGTAPDQIRNRETRKQRASAAEVEEVESPKKAINTLVGPNTKLYHGTDHVFTGGETVDGRKGSGSVGAIHNIDPSWKESKNVYSTSSLAEAQDYSGMRATSRFAPVYEVSTDTSHNMSELMRQDPMLKNSASSRKYKDVHVSQESVTPKAIVAWGENPRHNHMSPQFSSMLGAYSTMTGAPKE